MVYTYPLGLPALADKLKILSVLWDIKRNDELSGSGDGRTWQAELAPPLWTGEVQLASDYFNDAKQIAAIIRKLHGAQEAFFLYDPQSRYPQSDPSGAGLGASIVQVNSLGANNQSISLKGLPAGYVLTIGDKAQIAYSSAPVRNFFFEFSEAVVAGPAGVTPVVEIFPHIPAGIAVDLTVTLGKPACKVFIVPGTFNAGTARGSRASGAGFRVMERRR